MRARGVDAAVGGGIVCQIERREGRYGTSAVVRGGGLWSCSDVRPGGASRCHTGGGRAEAGRWRAVDVAAGGAATASLVGPCDPRDVRVRGEAAGVFKSGSDR